jgi:UDPglucose 6-dehydrogenase
MIGVGKLGNDCAEVLANHHSVIGYDVVQRTPKRFKMAPELRFAVDGAEYLFIAVPTPHEPGYGGETPSSQLEPKDFDYSILDGLCRELAKLVTFNQTVVIISTVLPGVIRSRVAPFFGNSQVLYNPYLIAMGSIAWDMRNPEMLIVGTSDGEATDQSRGLLKIYEPLLENTPRIVSGTWEEAEAVKIFYNTFISAKISLVNMILDVAEKCGHMNVDIVTDALKDSSQRIMGPRYMCAGMGDAGACHPRDNIALRHLASRLGLGYDLFGAIMRSREGQAYNMARRLVQLASAASLPIVIHGKAYKPLVPYIDGSYSLLVEHYVKELGGVVQYVDPMTGDSRTTDGPAVFLLAHNASVTYLNTGVDASGMPRFYCEIPAGSVILDPWRTIPAMQGVLVIPYGNTRTRYDRPEDVYERPSSVQQ